MIDISDNISEFEYYNGESVVGKGICGAVIKTNRLTEWKQLIKFTLEDEVYILDLFGRSEDTIVVSLDWEFFSNNELVELADKFGLVVKESSVLKGEGKTDYFRLVALINGKECFMKLAVKKVKSSNSYFFTFFNYDDGESRRSPVLYIFRISKVTLSGVLFEKMSKF